MFFNLLIFKYQVNMKKNLFFMSFLLAFLCYSCDNESVKGLGEGEENESGQTETPEDKDRIFSVENKTIIMSPYETVDIKIEDTKEDDNYIFISSDENIAKVIDGTTTVKPGTDGEAKITVKTSNGKYSQDVLITVTPFITEPLYKVGTTRTEIDTYEKSVGRKFITTINRTNGEYALVYDGMIGKVEMQIQYEMNSDNAIKGVGVMMELSVAEYDDYLDAAENFLRKRHIYKGVDQNVGKYLIFYIKDTNLEVRIEKFPSRIQIEYVTDEKNNMGYAKP